MDGCLDRQARGRAPAGNRSGCARPQTVPLPPKWRETRDGNKYDRLISFGYALPPIRERVEQDLAEPGLSRPKVLAAVVQLLERTLIRVGNGEYALGGEFLITVR